MEANAETLQTTSDRDLARMLAELDRRSDQEYETNKQAYQNTCGQIQVIGRELDRRGGEESMRRVLRLAGQLGCNTRFVEREWNGIGTWMD